MSTVKFPQIILLKNIKFWLLGEQCQDMFVNAKNLSSCRAALILFIVCASIFGCHRDAEGHMVKNNEGESVQILPQQSGYSGSVDDWKNFIECWQAHFLPPLDLEIKSILQGKVRETFSDDSRVMQDIAAAEARLGVKLPKSYRDFIKAFSALERQESDAVASYLGIFPVNQIGFSRDLAPIGVALAEQYPINVSDKDYLIYGIDQDSVSVRTKYVKDSILIGKYGSDSFEEILLHPQVIGSDGEMEVAINFHAGQFRAVSFAEMMRQLSYFELHLPDNMPGYPQELLQESCANLLPMKNVWWR